MKNAMQFKAYIKKLAIEKNISAQLVLQNYMLERLLGGVSNYILIQPCFYIYLI